jgi:hypothetical protein
VRPETTSNDTVVIEAPASATRRHPAVAALAALALPALIAAAGCGGDGADGARSGPQERSDRQDEVARRGAEVMPFDLEATTHHFEPTGDGLVQTVVADDPGDTEQVELIRAHLAEEAERFSRGDYGDPETIHGEAMPGLRELEAAAGAVTVDHESLDDGARLTFTTDDPALVDALHRWGEAQVADHGHHAEP